MKFRVVIRNGSNVIFSEDMTAEDERDVLGQLLIASELFGRSFTEVRITEI